MSRMQGSNANVNFPQHCLMACMLEYPGLRKPTVRLATMENLLCEAGDVREASERKVWTSTEMFKEVHGGRKLHWGSRRTW